MLNQLSHPGSPTRVNFLKLSRNVESEISINEIYVSVTLKPVVTFTGLKNYFFMFIYFKREGVRALRVRTSGGGAESEGEGESQAGSELSAQSPPWGSVSQTVRS